MQTLGARCYTVTQSIQLQRVKVQETEQVPVTAESLSCRLTLSFNGCKQIDSDLAGVQKLLTECRGFLCGDCFSLNKPSRPQPGAGACKR